MNDTKIMIDPEKLRVMEEIVRDKQINFGYAPLSDAAARRQAEVWYDQLEDIPTNRLRDVFKKAMRERDPKSAFSTTDMSQAWRRLTEQETLYRRMNPPCPMCHDTRQIIYDKDGVGRVTEECPAC
jgi:hypothetical protein